MTAKTLEKLFRPRKITKNILAPHCDPVTVGKRTWALADGILRSVAQNCIDDENVHRHLRGAKILLLIRHGEADKKKIQTGGLERHLGHAQKAAAVMRFVSAMGLGAERQADFVIWLNGPWLESLGWREGLRIPPASQRPIAASIYHELSHCGAQRAGAFVAETELDVFLAGLGPRLIEVCHHVVDDKGRKLVRYYKSAEGHLVWTMRHHDIEEFNEVLERFGAWRDCLQRLVDVLEEIEPLFNQPPKEPAV